MANRLFSRVWMMRLVFPGLCIAIIFLNLLPLNTTPRAWAGPDLLPAFTFAWVLRRPEFVPIVMIAAIMLLADLLFQRPPGLWAALVVLGSEVLRSRAPALRDLSFPVEWFNVAVVLTFMAIGYQLALAIFATDRPSLGLSLMQLVLTLAVYPVVVLVTQGVLGVRKPAPGDLDALGNRV